ncbi:MAG: hypothetical protein AB2389_15610 [Paraclostridium dentum]
MMKKGDNYRATFKLVLSFVSSQIKKGVKAMVELKGTEKQVKWANDIREEILKGFDVIVDIKKLIEIKKEELTSVKGRKLDSKVKFIETRTWLVNKMENLKTIIENNENATFFINNRGLVRTKDIGTVVDPKLVTHLNPDALSTLIERNLQDEFLKENLEKDFYFLDDMIRKTNSQLEKKGLREF